ncbi:MAG: methyltransferase type 12 [Sulfurisoma sp.]|nr:methyltransferase type 12 [Sulfurisoma sp.]
MTRWEPEPIPPLRAALIAQVLGGLIAGGLVALVFQRMLKSGDIPFAYLLGFAVFQGFCAAFVSHKLEAPRWWLPIHLGFMPLAVLASRLAIAPAWYLAGFILLLLVFWRTDTSRVPLYLSNAATARAVVGLLPATPCHVVDLGCGDGRLLKTLARERPDCEFVGIEHAPLTWLWARLNTAGLPNCRVRRGDFWAQHLGLFEVAYAFLSPVPMARLWAKAGAEMRPGSLLVSNSFEIPGVAAETIVEVTDSRATQLYCYRPAGR